MKKIIAPTILIVGLWCAIVNARVILSDNFDSQVDWNSTTNTSPPTESIWTSAIQTNYGGSLYVMYIDSTVRHGTSGKGLRQYWDYRDPAGSAQDAWLYTADITWSSETQIYIGYWWKIDTNMLTLIEEVDNLKVMKLQTASGGTWDLGYWKSFSPYCCSPTGCYPPDGCSKILGTDQQGNKSFGCWTDVIDGEWHSFIWGINFTTGELSLEIDGVDADNTPSCSTTIQGTNLVDDYFSIGGNMVGSYQGYPEGYTAWDDIIVATTKAEVETFLGIEGSTPPSTPSTPTIRNGGIR